MANTKEVQAFQKDMIGAVTRMVEQSIERDTPDREDDSHETGYRCGIIDLLQEMLGLGTRETLSEGEFYGNRVIVFTKMDPYRTHAH